MTPSQSNLRDQTEALRVRLAEAEEMLQAIRHGEIDALVVEGAGGSQQVYTLHSADEPYRHLVEEMQEGAVVLTPRGNILYSNARFAALVGEPLESVLGSRIDRFLAVTAGNDFGDLLRAGNGRRRGRLIASDSSALEVSLSLTTTVSANGDRLNLIVTDLSELLAANTHRARAEHDNRATNQFLAMLSHELRTPLSAISTAVRVLEVTNAGEQPRSRPYEVIARQVGHVTHLINDLLDVERVVSGKIRLNRQPLDMAEAVRQGVATFIGESQLDLRLDIDAEPVWVDWDAERLEQVLSNIVTNAIKYTPPGGQIRVSLRAEGGDAILTVEDTGVGISPRLLPYVFDLYVQADRTLDRARGGLGIGLALVRRLVELHGGTIAASSEGEGKGSRFTVRLGRIPAADGLPRVPLPQEDSPSRKRVLLIEDNKDAREMLRMMLELAGHVVYEAADGVTGLELVNAERPDVGIIDIGLPRMDGYQVARRIRDLPHGRDMLLLALTGYGSPADVKRSEEHGFDHHLVKPVDPDFLTRVIHQTVAS
jgi:signal transduction histidine kinase/CheY-like chemotaxis protein